MSEQQSFIVSGFGIIPTMTKKYAVLGSPIEHSLSPKIHALCFSRTLIAASYLRFEVSRDLGGFLANHLDFSGFSLTMPLKEEGFAVADSLSVLARKTRCVNTLLLSSKGYSGFNTDVYGIQMAVGFEPAEIAVLGSGATARSALAAFPEANKLIFARNASVASEIAKEFDATNVTLAEALSAEVVVSTLPTGVLPELIGNGVELKTLLDVAYTNPTLQAENYVSGLEMLIHQAIAQQRIFQFGDEDQELDKESELLEELYELLIMAK